MTFDFRNLAVQIRDKSPLVFEILLDHLAAAAWGPHLKPYMRERLLMGFEYLSDDSLFRFFDLHGIYISIEWQPSSDSGLFRWNIGGLNAVATSELFSEREGCNHHAFIAASEILQSHVGNG